MEFSRIKANALKPRKEKYLSTFLIALFTAMALFVPYMLMAEGYFTFYGDFNVQQIPFYQQCHKAIREGNIFWSWTTDLGANFIGSYSFYLLGSPFFWLTIPFPNSFVPYLMGPLLILKFACAALMGYMYIRRFTRTPDAARIGGILYAFSGFSIYNIFFNHFHEAIIFFPLLLLSLELLITENKRFYFALAVCLCAISNYYFFFGMVVFCVIYYFVRVLSRAVKFKLSSFLTLGFEAVLGLLLSAILLLPAILAIENNYRVTQFLSGWNAIMYSKEQIYGNILQCFFFPPDIPARPVFFPDANVKWSSLGGWLPIFSTVGVFTWFSKRKKNWLGRLVGICIFMALVPFLNSAFSACNSAYYARWFYMPILMICLMTVSLTEDSKIDWGYGYKWVFGITVAIGLVIGLFPQESEGKWNLGLYTQSDSKIYFFRFLIASVIAVMSLVILGFLLKIRKNSLKTFYRATLACVCAISIIYGNVFIATGRSHSYDIKNVVVDSLIEGEVDLGDKTQFRVDCYDCADNTSMTLGFNGINAFHSIVPSSVFEFYSFIGVERSVGSRPDVNQTALRPLLSVKYLLNRIDGNDFIDSETHETKMPDYKYLKTESGYYIYENKNYIPYGFSYDYYMTKKFCESYDEKNRAALMLKAILLSDEQIEKYGYMFEDIRDGEYVSLTDESMAEDCNKRADTSAYYFKTDNQGFTARVNGEKETLVFFSVPYDKGWSATVNGVACDVEKVNIGFMAVKVPAGDSVIRFSYETPGLSTGIEITFVSAIVLLLYIIVYSVYSRKHKKIAEYPEGEILINKWKVEEETEPYVIELDSEPPKSILDNDVNIEISDIPEKFEGGFKINTDFDK
ncbi:MAG: YfhO family protein [Clostridia bacterium]|nr:YfhO family protein [Clostridia bacterium]